MAQLTDKNRMLYIDVAKAICIVLMVCGHSDAPFTHWIYLFHLTVFYILSGFCWNERHSNNLESVKLYVVGRIRRLYFPYVICNAVFVLLNNVFLKTGIYSDNPRFLEIAGKGASYGLGQHYSVLQTIITVAKCFVFNSTQMGGATWFIAILFIVTVGHCILERIIKAIHLYDYSAWIYAAIMLMLIVADWLIKKYLDLSFVGMLGALLLGYASYLMGIILHRNHEKLLKYYNVITAVIAFVALLILDRHGDVYVGNGTITNPLFFIACAIAGWTAVVSVSKIIPTILQKPLLYVGKHTMPIVLLHFCDLKLVSYVYVSVTGIDKLLLASFPIIFDTNIYMWMVYTIVGATVPLLISKLYFLSKDRLLKNR